MARKLALIIGNSQYEDTCLAKLAAPDVDARALAEVLKAPGIGGFNEVTPLLNEGLATVRKAVARFFDLKHRDDLLFLYFSGHGVRDELGHLYLAVRDTERAVLAGTAIEASYVTTRMDRSASKRLVLVLDCCHSGAFGYGSKAAQGASVGTASAFEGTGRGRVVLTATDSTQYAWEGDQIIGDVENSLFTHYLIEGLRSGAADRDEDGHVTIDELYDYVYEHVLSNTPKQTPGKWAFGQQGEIIIAQNPNVSVAKLPPEVEEALKSTLPSVRLQVLGELNAIARGRHEGKAKAARAALQRLSEDDSRKVAASALVLVQALDQDEPISEDEWQRRAREKEDEQSGRKTVAAQIASYVTTGESCLERGALDDAREMVTRALTLDAQDAEALRLLARLEQAVEERTRLEQAENQIRELRKNISSLIARANAAGPHDEAIALLNEALGLDPEHAEVKQLLEARLRLKAEADAAERARLERKAEEVKRQQAEAERRAQIDGQVSEAARHLARENITKAIVITEAILRADPDHTAARALHAKAQHAVEAKRKAEQRAAAEREQQRKIDDMLATAEAAATPDTAVEILNDLLTHDPANSKAQRLLKQRHAELAAARGEQRRAEAEEILRVRRAEQEKDALAAREADLEEERARAEAQGAAQPPQALAFAGVDTTQPTGFSLRPTLSRPWIWLTGAALRSNTFRIVSGMVLAVGLSWSVYNQATRPEYPPPVATRDSGPAVAPDPPQPTAKRQDPVPPAVSPDKTEDKSGIADPKPRGGRGGASSAIGRSTRSNSIDRPAIGPAARETKAPAAAPASGPPPTSATPPPTEREKPKTPSEPSAVRTPPDSTATPTNVPTPSGTTPAGGTKSRIAEPPAKPAPVPDEASVREAVKAYAQAVSSGSRDAVKGLYPSIPDRELDEIATLKDNFGGDRYAMTILIKEIDFRENGTRADVKSSVFHNGVDDTNKHLQRSRNETFHFRWTGSSWVRIR